ncbi:hypothetical protein AJ78_07244 [Emergomyces pasteurianus Ep9510]|uniref:Transcription factor domain-containing protein n=1 Tax=Emergomyces pasteurianus Ep9510 TaxID=1447872 RepID=A0A1J9Q843_9EURO|nr:hypothetical protein AJ78_07244 [Emergomyces pasteurianus Ep9510]
MEDRSVSDRTESLTAADSLPPSPASALSSAHAPTLSSGPNISVEHSALLAFKQLIPPDSREASELLTFFCSEMAPMYPFTRLPWGITPQELLLEKPLLYMVILGVAYQSDTQKQQILAKMFREEISHSILICGEMSLGILQALLVYSAWNHVHMKLEARLSNLLPLAMVMAADLEISREPHTRSKTSPGALREVARALGAPNSRTLEERRAFLGVFWLSSVTKACAKEIDGMRFSKYADQCCHILQEAMEYPTDSYLVHLVRIQQIADRIGATVYSENLMGSFAVNESAATPLAISSLEKEVQVMGDKISEMQHLVIPPASYLYKIALDDRLFSPSSATTSGFLWTSSTGVLPSNTTSTVRRTDLLVSCLFAIKSLADHFLALTDAVIFSLPYPTWLQLGHCILILTRVMEVRHNTWDLSYVSHLLDFREVLNRLARRLDKVIRRGREARPARHLPVIFEGVVERLGEIGKVIGEGLHAVGSGNNRNDDAHNAICNSYGDGNEGWIGAGAVRDGTVICGDETSLMFDDEITQAMCEFFGVGV